MALADGDADNLLRPHPSRLDPRRTDYSAILERHRQALAAGDAGYTDPASGLFVLTAAYLAGRGTCCDSGCRHCPFLPRVSEDEGWDPGGIG